MTTWAGVKAGTVLPCLNGHPMYVQIEDVRVGERANTWGQAIGPGEQGDPPMTGTAMPRCRHCGALLAMPVFRYEDGKEPVLLWRWTGEFEMRDETPINSGRVKSIGIAEPVMYHPTEARVLTAAERPAL